MASGAGIDCMKTHCSPCSLALHIALAAALGTATTESQARSIVLDSFAHGDDAFADARPTTNWEAEFIQEGLPETKVIGGARGFRSGASSSGDPEDANDVASSGYSSTGQRVIFRSKDSTVPGSDIHDGHHFTASHSVSWGDTKDLNLDPFEQTGGDDPVIELHITNATISGAMRLTLATDLDGLGVVQSVEKTFDMHEGLQRITWKLSEFTSAFTDDIDHIELSTAYYTEHTGNKEDRIEMSEFALRSNGLLTLPDRWDFELETEFSEGTFSLSWKHRDSVSYSVERSTDGVNWKRIEVPVSEPVDGRQSADLDVSALSIALFRVSATPSPQSP